MSNFEFEHIPQEEFAFVQKDTTLHDQKLETKSRSYFADALLRFRKNKSSVIAAWILLFLLLFAIVSPLISPYDVNQKDIRYANMPSYVPFMAEKGWGFNAPYTLKGQNDKGMEVLEGMGVETGMNPLIEILKTNETEVIYRGQPRIEYSYDVSVNKLYNVGIIYQNLSYEDFADIQKWQSETGVQVIYPYVLPEDINGIDDEPKIWYKMDKKNMAVRDENGNFIPAYSTDKSKEGAEYNSLRVEGDDGSYIYSIAKDGSVRCRVCYYNYYWYRVGHEPIFILGTNSVGQDLFAAIGMGARFSILFAILVSAINLTIGTIYGAIQGYYGGWVDMLLDRIADILSGVPFLVVTTLFQLHLAKKVGVVGSFLFAFVLTGWIGMSALVRKQFYRFKSQEFVMAARTLGASDKRLMFKHIFPNGLGTIITSCALVIPGVISSETNMTYLGIVNLSEVAGTSIGTLMAQGQANVTTSPHAMLWPSIFVALLMISFNLFGNGLRDAFNPTTRGAEE